MKQEDIQKIIEVRTHLIEFYNALNMKKSPGADIGVVKQSDVATELGLNWESRRTSGRIREF